MIHVVGLSGGKDSTALALRLAETSPQDKVVPCMKCNRCGWSGSA